MDRLREGPGLLLQGLQPRLLPHVVAARLEECREDNRAADRACVRDVLAIGTVEALLVAACGLDVGKEAVVGVRVAEGALAATNIDPTHVAPFRVVIPLRQRRVLTKHPSTWS